MLLRIRKQNKIETWNQFVGIAAKFGVSSFYSELDARSMNHDFWKKPFHIARKTFFWLLQKLSSSYLENLLHLEKSLSLSFLGERSLFREGFSERLYETSWSVFEAFWGNLSKLIWKTCPKSMENLNKALSTTCLKIYYKFLCKSFHKLFGEVFPSVLEQLLQTIWRCFPKIMLKIL